MKQDLWRSLSRFSFTLLILSFVSMAVSPVSAQAQESMDGQAKVIHYTNAVDSYIRGLNEKDLESILVLYAENGTVEDPVGSKLVSGKHSLREFYTGAVNIDLMLTRTGPVRVAGVEAAFPFQLLMEVNGTRMKTDIIDVFRFDEDGKIISMRAFWGPSNRRVATE